MQGLAWYRYEQKRAAAEKHAQWVQTALEWAANGRKDSLRRADLHGADLRGVNLGKTQDDETTADLSYANLKNANLGRHLRPTWPAPTWEPTWRRQPDDANLSCCQPVGATATLTWRANLGGAPDGLTCGANLRAT